MNRLDKWHVSTAESELTGAAAAFLSICDLGLLLDSPLWCSAITSKKIEIINSLWPKRMYSTLVEENDLVFGAKEKLSACAKQMLQEYHYSVIAVAFNCGPALMGDDVEGICGEVTDLPVISVDAGGFTGEADQGWSNAILALLKKQIVSPQNKKTDVINLLGCASYDSQSSLLIEQQKLLYPEAKFQIPGYCEMTYADLPKLLEAAFSVVVHPRGLQVGEWLLENYKVDYTFGGE